MPPAAPAVVYISSAGMLEPLGQSQVLAYLERLAADYRIHLISYEKPGDWRDETQRRRVSDRIRRAGLHWHPLRYHKRPTLPATLYDVSRGTALTLWLRWRYGARLVHARSYVPALAAWLCTRLTPKLRFLFDMRGFWADERVDGGLWRRGGALYRLTKRLERRFLNDADQVVTLTYASRAHLQEGAAAGHAGQAPAAPIAVIPTCVDLSHFTPMARPASHVPGGSVRDQAFVLGYIGSVGTWYLFDEMLACYQQLTRQCPQARLHLVNKGDHAYIKERLTAYAIPEAAVLLRTATHAEMAEHIRAMHAGTAIIKPAYSKIASAPTKLGEYLACGLPVLGTRGIGDMEAILEQEAVGVGLASFDEPARAQAVAALLALAETPETAARCRDVAERIFSLEAGVASYRRLYQHLTADGT